MPKPPRQTTPKGRFSDHAAPITDSRFANFQTDPRFRIPSKKRTHVQLDDRFARMLNDEDFAGRARVDRYGRKNAKGSGRKELEKYYAIEENEAEDRLKSKDAEHLSEIPHVEREYDPARDGGFSASDSSSDEEDDDDTSTTSDQEEDKTQLEDQVLRASELQDQGAEMPIGEITSRLAVVNLDWENIRATDLFAVFSSFCPQSGHVERASIYPSQFGKERMEKEDLEGPPKELFAQSKRGRPAANTSNESPGNGNDSEESEEEGDDRLKQSLVQEDRGEEFDSAMLRRYQLERLRYYYAVIKFSSSSTAKALYDACDGAEFLSTANFFDLRFIPDGVNFDDDRPRDKCSSLPEAYKPNSFVTDALQHSRVKLTWDADDGHRREAVKKAFSGNRAAIEENDLKAYIGTDSSEDDSGQQENGLGQNGNAEGHGPSKIDERRKLRAAFGLGDESIKSSKSRRDKSPVGDMQITFTAGLSGKDEDGIAPGKQHSGREETTIEKYRRKEKERKQRKKEKSGIEHNDSDDANEKFEIGANEGPGSMDFDDPFFAEPSRGKSYRAQEKKGSKAERIAKSQERKHEEAETARKRAELELLMIEDEKEDKSSNKEPISHFDMDEIAKAEKKKRRKQRRGQDDVEGSVEQQPDFQVDTEDPRFSAIFSNHEFAIDPTNPRYRATQGMKSLLDEGRKRRHRNDADDDLHPFSKKPSRSKVSGKSNGEDIGRLVEKFQKRQKG